MCTKTVLSVLLLLLQTCNNECYNITSKDDRMNRSTIAINDNDSDVSSNDVDDDLLVSTIFGDVRGQRVMLGNGDTQRVFKGIPFAKPPVGTLRFKSPEPPLPWKGVRDASIYGNRCPQPPSGMLVNNTGMDEECLYLNIYSPQMVNQSLLPVMVWIHGGAYIGGSGSDFHATIVASKGVVIVTINYRLDALGFLSTEDNVMPGNFGILDQIMALKWIQQNIQAFGGDPNLVTIFGQSAGGHSTSLLILSPLAKGLFHRAIMQSGSSLAPSAVKLPREYVQHKDFAKLLGSKLKCDFQDSVSYLTCLQNRTASEILEASLNVQVEEGIFMTLKPRVENVFGVLPDYPNILLERGSISQVDTLQGFTANELGGEVVDPEDDGITLQEFKTFINHTIKDFDINNKDALVQSLVDFMKADSTDSFVRRSKLETILSDFAIVSSTIHEADSFVKNSVDKSHYLYRLSYRADYQSYLPLWMGVPHGMDIPLVVGLAPDTSARLIGSGTPDVTDYLMADYFVSLWTNFAKFGNPTPASEGKVSWSPYNYSSPFILDLQPAPKNSVVERMYSDIVYITLNLNLFLPLRDSSTVVG